jgi:hypothetical protein
MYRRKRPWPNSIYYPGAGALTSRSQRCMVLYLWFMKRRCRLYTVGCWDESELEKMMKEAVVT